MRYCKHCGRELKDGVRFCERCGKSVRQSRNNENVKKQEQIEKLQKERLQRKRRQEQREIIENKRKERIKAKRAKHNKVFFIITGTIAAIAVIALISFAVNLDSDTAWDNVSITPPAETALPTMQPSNTQAPVSEVEEGSNNALNTIAANKNEFSVCELSNGMEIPYPEVFEKDEADDDEELNLSDDFGGGATMVVFCEEYPGGTASGLMKKYASEQPGEVTDSLANGDRYTITIDDDGEITHRTYLIERDSDTVVYYDFVYEKDSDYADDYKKYIKYIDNSLKPETPKSQS